MKRTVKQVRKFISFPSFSTPSFPAASLIGIAAVIVVVGVSSAITLSGAVISGEAENSAQNYTGNSHRRSEKPSEGLKDQGDLKGGLDISAGAAGSLSAGGEKAAAREANGRSTTDHLKNNSLREKTTFFSRSSQSNLQRTEEILASMDDTELLGQVLLLGYSGITPLEEFLSWISDKKIGGVKLFGHNTTNLSLMTQAISTMQRRAVDTELQIPLFIATDQEGGWVRHVRGNTTQTPGNMAIGATNLPYDAYNTGYHLGQELKALGINMNFAPTVDLHIDPGAYVVGTRAFSDDPQKSAELGVAFFKGHDKAGVISTGKHFPGHGNTHLDSHGIMPVIEHDIETLWDLDLMPYRFLIRRNIPAVMSAHIAFPGISGNNKPASLSPEVLRGLLREKMGFEGLIITDDMRMVGALGSGLSTVDACLAALKAGNDIIMISRDLEMQQRVWERLYRELQNNQEFRTTIENSVRRILLTKLNYLNNDRSVPLFPRWGDPEHPFPSGASFFLNHAFRSVTTIKNGSLPLTPDNWGRILVAGQVNLFLNLARDFFPGADFYSFPFSHTRIPRQEDLVNLPRLAEQYDTIVFCLANPNSREVLKALEGTSARVVVLSVLSPFYLHSIDWIDSAIAVYGTHQDSILAGLYVLTGKIEAAGNLPVNLVLESEAPGE